MDERINLFPHFFHVGVMIVKLFVDVSGLKSVFIFSISASRI